MPPATVLRNEADPSAADALGTRPLHPQASHLQASPQELIGTGEALPAAPPGGARLLDWLRRSGRGVAALVAAWVLWLLAATQLPQAAAPLPVSDGLARGDWILLEALGLHSLGDGLPLWLLSALTLAFGIGFVGLARITSAPAERSPPSARLPRLLAALAVVAWIAAIVVAAAVDAPRWIELPVTGAAAPPVQPAQALSFELGRWQRSAMTAASCVAVDAEMRCSLPGNDEPLVFRGHQTVEREGVVWTRRGVQSDAEAAAGRLELDDSISGQGRVGFDVGAERATIIPALRARVALVGTKRSGPVLTGRIGDGSTLLLAGPGLANGEAVARLRAVHRVRLLGASPWPGFVGLFAAAAALLAALWLVLRPTTNSNGRERWESGTASEAVDPALAQEVVP